LDNYDEFEMFFEKVTDEKTFSYVYLKAKIHFLMFIISILFFLYPNLYEKIQKDNFTAP